MFKNITDISGKFKNTILLTSIPRDYYVTTVCGENDSCMNNSLDKITYTGIAGVNTTKKKVENLFGMMLLEALIFKLTLAQIKERASRKMEQYMVDGVGDSLMCAQ